MTKEELQELRKLRRNIRVTEDRLRHDRTRLSKLETEAEEYISAIQDTYIASILRLRFIDGKRWRDVALTIGGSNSEDSIRMMCYRYLKSAELQ